MSIFKFLDIGKVLGGAIAPIAPPPWARPCLEIPDHAYRKKNSSKFPKMCFDPKILFATFSGHRS